MCRIVGYIDQSSQMYQYDRENVLRSMRDSMINGGPDNAGEYFDTSICLGHRRLSILDLSSAGNQPIYYNNKIIIFNGEIYNYRSIASELRTLDVNIESNSDTEVLIKAIDYWGITEAVSKFHGMFAFAIWNKDDGTLLLCRDRLGVKPLYIYKNDGLLLFASELKAFHQHPRFNKKINQREVLKFLQKGYIDSVGSIFEYVNKLEPGCIYVYDSHTLDLVSNTKYWNGVDIYNQNREFKYDEFEVFSKCEELLKESFKYRMVSDVPVGVFLSGGLDSSLVTSMLQKESSEKIKTFTVGFEDNKLNEAVYAKDISNYLGTEHYEIYCKNSDIKNCIDIHPVIFDEPLGTASSIPTYLVSKMASEEVKVCLSADGGDELFGGYSKYEATMRYYPKLSRIPSFVRRSVFNMTSNLNAHRAESILSNWPVFNNYTNISNKLLKLRGVLNSKSIYDFFESSSSYISDSELERISSIQFEKKNYKIIPEDDRMLSYFGLIDLDSYLEGEILVKVDRATMFNSIEGRDPFLDHKLIEFALHLPDKYKLREGNGKYILKKILNKYLPSRFTDRPKSGFVIPIYSLLYNDLRTEILSISENKRFFEVFMMNREKLTCIIDDFYSQKNTVNPYLVWHIYILYRWYLQWID